MPNVNSAGQTHDQLQAACWKGALQLYHPYLYQRLICIPNDMHAGNVVRWKQYQALGVTPGVWDMQLNWFRIEQTSGLTMQPVNYKIHQSIYWFEFKVGRDTRNPAQLRFQQIMEPIGHKFYIIEEEKQFYDYLKNIIEPTLHIAKQIWKEEQALNGERKTRSRPDQDKSKRI